MSAPSTGTPVTAILDAIYGDETRRSYMPDEVGAVKRMIHDRHLTPVRARHLMDFVRRTPRFAYVKTAVALETHYLMVSGAAEANQDQIYRPYDAPRSPSREALRPEQMFVGIVDPEMRKVRDDLAARIAAAEAQGIRGPALFRAIHGWDFKAETVANETKLPREVVAGARADVRAERAAEQPVLPMPEGFDLVRARLDLEARAQAIESAPGMEAEYLRLVRLISWCVDNPEAGETEFRRETIDSKVQANMGVAA